MKRLFGLIIFVLVIYVIYYDLSNGTLPIAMETSTKAETKKTETEEANTKMSYFEKKVESGDTVLSIVENQLQSSIPVSIQTVVNDFQLLNAGAEAEQIQLGKTYKFPDYRNIEE